MLYCRSWRWFGLTVDGPGTGLSSGSFCLLAREVSLSLPSGFWNIIIIIIIIIIINILTAIGLAPGGSSPVHIYREHYIEHTNNT